MFDILTVDRATIRPVDAAKVHVEGKPYRLESMVQFYATGQAEKAVAALKTAVKIRTASEPEFRRPGLPWTKAKAVDNTLPTVADEDIGYAMWWGTKGNVSFATVSVVRTGDTLIVTLATADKSGEPHALTPDFKVLRAQTTKVTGKD